MLDEWFFEMIRLKESGLKRGAEKGYTMNVPFNQILDHFKEEWAELLDAYEKGHLNLMVKELADLSNMCDLFFEELHKLKEGRR